MKKITQIIAISLLLISTNILFACDNSSFTLLSTTDLGSGMYEFEVEFCAGGGQDLTGYGAENGTADWGVQLVNASIVSYPASMTSPQTGAIYNAAPYLTNYVFYELYSYPGVGFGADWWTTIYGGWGPPASYCVTFSIVTNGMPTQIILMGAEGAGVGVAPYGCNGLPEMEINFGLAADAGVYQNVCAGSCTTLNATATGGTAPYTYLWSNGATTATTTVCPVDAETLYSVTVTDANGITDYDDVPLYVNSLPIANAGPDKTVNYGYGSNCTTLNGSASGNTAPYSYAWSNGSTSAVPTVCPTTTTTYTLTVTNYYGCTKTDQVVVNVRDVRCGPQLNKIYVCKAGTTKCINSNQVISHLNNGWVLGACGTRLTEEIESDENPIAVFPNPASNSSEIIFIPAIDEPATISVVDASGRMYANEIIEVRGAEENSHLLDVQYYPSGIYLVVIQTNSGEMLTAKLQVIR